MSTKKNSTNKLSNADMKRLIDNYGNDLLKLCTLYLKDRYLAEDALQDTYIKVWENYSSFNNLSNEKTWITRIAINTCKDYMRKKWFKKNASSDLLEIVGVSNGNTQIEQSIDIMNEMLKLNEKYRIVLIMYYYEEYSIKEISEILQKNQSTVLSLLKRGRDKLKIKLIDNLYEGGGCYEI